MSGKVITVLSTKGGIGKSTIARFIGIIANEADKKVCIVDTCQNSSIATGFFQDRDSFKKSGYDWLTEQAKPSEVIQQYKDSNIYYIPSDERIDDFEDWVLKKVPRVKQLEFLSKKIEPLKQLFDYIIIDTHPNENSDIVNYSIAAADYCVIPSEIDLDSKLAALRCVEIIEEYKQADYQIDYGIVFSKVELSKGKGRIHMQKMKEELLNEGISEEKFLGSIRYSTVVSSAKNEGIMLNELGNKYSQNVMNDFREVASEIFERVGE